MLQPARPLQLTHIKPRRAPCWNRHISPLVTYKRRPSPTTLTSPGPKPISTSFTMANTFKTLSPKAAAALDAELMSEEGGYSIDQLMELAGLACACSLYKCHAPSSGKRILIAAGPGNNGGDGLVAARHLHHFGYDVVVYYPKPTKKPIFDGLVKQLVGLGIEFRNEEDFETLARECDLIVDALFGFSFRPPVREPFDKAIRVLEARVKPVLAVDTPSSWDVENGPQSEGLGSGYMPEYLVSLTAPKPSVKYFKGKKHFVGGRFLGKGIADKYGLDVPRYEGVEQVVEVPVEGEIGKL